MAAAASSSPSMTGARSSAAVFSTFSTGAARAVGLTGAGVGRVTAEVIS